MDLVAAAEAVERAWWAEQFRKGCAEVDLARIIYELPVYTPPPLSPGIRWNDCNCPYYSTCMNTACPRAARITCS